MCDEHDEDDEPIGEEAFEELLERVEALEQLRDRVVFQDELSYVDEQRERIGRLLLSRAGRPHGSRGGGRGALAGNERLSPAGCRLVSM